MLVVHMDSGLGNQMLDYAEFLAIQKTNPNQKCYLENLIYELPAKQGMISMWNGYELERIFGIKIPNVKELFNDKQWKEILKEVEGSQFWEDDWNFTPPIIAALEKQGLKLHNFGKIPGKIQKRPQNMKDTIFYVKTKFFQTAPGYHLKRILRKIMKNYLVQKVEQKYNIYRIYPQNSFVGHSFGFKYRGTGIEAVEKEIREAFQFPEIIDEKNLKILETIQSTNSVSIHARRSDLLFLNGHCYKFGFFKRAVKYIKKHVKDPVFIFFTDENSIGWCEENEKIFGLDFKKDRVEFVTWNKGEDSFRDMQLMAECKHNIFTESTFGFWGAFLNSNPAKITCAPDVTILSTNTL